VHDRHGGERVVQSYLKKANPVRMTRRLVGTPFGGVTGPRFPGGAPSGKDCGRVPPGFPDGAHNLLCRSETRRRPALGEAVTTESNLMSTGTRRLDDKQKAAIAAEWAGSGLSQEAWARQHGISGRSLRQYLRRFQPARHWDTELQAVVARAMCAMNAIIEAMAAQASAAPPCPAASVPAPELPGGNQSATVLPQTPAPMAEPLTESPKVEMASSRGPNPDKKRRGFDWETGMYWSG
jgi:transposase-like protein